MHGVYGQKITASGLRLWGAQGKELVPLGSSTRTFVNALEVAPLTINLKRPAYVDDIDAVLKAKAPNLVMIDAIPMAKELGDIRLVNVLMLGALSRKLDLDQEHWDAAIKSRFKEKFHAGCMAAFQMGSGLVS